MDPAALVYSRFPLLQRAFESDTVIRAGGAKWLTIPNPDVWPNGRIIAAAACEDPGPAVSTSPVSGSAS